MVINCNLEITFCPLVHLSTDCFILEWLTFLHIIRYVPLILSKVALYKK
jgi:hypothetical protein